MGSSNKNRLTLQNICQRKSSKDNASKPNPPWHESWGRGKLINQMKSIDEYFFLFLQQSFFMIYWNLKGWLIDWVIYFICFIYWFVNSLLIDEPNNNFTIHKNISTLQRLQKEVMYMNFQLNYFDSWSFSVSCSCLGFLAEWSTVHLATCQDVVQQCWCRYSPSTFTFRYMPELFLQSNWIYWILNIAFVLRRAFVYIELSLEHLVDVIRCVSVCLKSRAYQYPWQHHRVAQLGFSDIRLSIDDAEQLYSCIAPLFTFRLHTIHESRVSCRKGIPTLRVDARWLV